MYSVFTMHAIFVFLYWVNMRPFNRIQPTELQLYSNQSTLGLGWGGPKPTLTLSSHICRSVPAHQLPTRLEEPGSIPGRARWPCFSEFSVVLSEIRVNMG